MKPDLTPAKPWGFHLTGHLNLLQSPGLEGKRVSMELMEKTGCYREDPCQDVHGPPSLASYLTGVNPRLSRISDKTGKCCTSYFVSNSQNTHFALVVFGDSVVRGKDIVPASSKLPCKMEKLKRRPNNNKNTSGST